MRFPGRLPHPRKGPIVRTEMDRTYDVAAATDGMLAWTIVGAVPGGGERSGRWTPRDPGGTPPDEGDAVLIALAPPRAPVWDAFCRDLSLDPDAATFRAACGRSGRTASLRGTTAATEGSHRVGRYADTAPVRTDWSARWTWTGRGVQIDLRSSVAHGAPQAAELKPRPFWPDYVTQFEARIVVTRRPARG